MKPDQDDFEPEQAFVPAKQQIHPDVLAVREINDQIKDAARGFNVLGHFPATGVNAFVDMKGRILHAIANPQKGDVVIQIGKPINGIAHTNEVLLRKGNFNSLDIFGVIDDSISLTRVLKERILPAIPDDFPGVMHLGITGRNEGAFHFLAKQMVAEPEDVPTANGLIYSFGLPVPGAVPPVPLVYPKPRKLGEPVARPTPDSAG